MGPWGGPDLTPEVCSLQLGREWRGCGGGLLRLLLSKRGRRVIGLPCPEAWWSLSIGGSGGRWGSMQGLQRDRRSWRAEASSGEGAPHPQAFLGASFSLTLPVSRSRSQKCLRLEGRQLNRAIARIQGTLHWGLSHNTHTHTHINTWVTQFPLSPPPSPPRPPSLAVSDSAPLPDCCQLRGYSKLIDLRLLAKVIGS